MGEFFRDGGMFMYFTAFFGFLLAGASWLTLTRPKRYWRVTALLALATGASGMLGTVAGLIATFRFVARLAPKEGALEALMTAAVGIAESLNNLVLATVILLVSSIAAVVAAARATRKDEAPAQ